MTVLFHFIEAQKIRLAWEMLMTKLQAYLRETVGLVPDHYNKASIPLKRVTEIFALSSVSLSSVQKPKPKQTPLKPQYTYCN